MQWRSEGMEMGIKIALLPASNALAQVGRVGINTALSLLTSEEIHLKLRGKIRTTLFT